MPLKLVLYQDPSEMEEIVRTCVQGFEDPDARCRHIYFPPQDTYERMIANGVQDLTYLAQHHPDQQWIKVIDTETGAIQGAAEWQFFSQRPYDTPFAIECVRFKDPVEKMAADHLMVQFLEPRNKWMNMPHVFLNILYTCPSARRKGVGRMLVDWGVTEADKRGLPTYIDATAQGKELYKNFGFHLGPRHEYFLPPNLDTADSERLEKFLVPFEWWPMYRPAKNADDEDALPPWERDIS